MIESIGQPQQQPYDVELDMVGMYLDSEGTRVAQSRPASFDRARGSLKPDIDSLTARQEDSAAETEVQSNGVEHDLECCFNKTRSQLEKRERYTGDVAKEKRWHHREIYIGTCF